MLIIFFTGTKNADENIYRDCIFFCRN